MDDLAGFVLFVLFGILVIFIIVRIVKAASRTVDKEQGAHPREGGQMFCPNCGKKVGESDSFCRFCGRSLSTEKPASDADVQPRPRHPEQRSTLVLDQPAAPKLSQGVSPMPAVPVPKKPFPMIPVLGGVVLLIGLEGVGFWYRSRQWGKPQPEPQVAAQPQRPTPALASVVTRAATPAAKKRAAKPGHAPMQASELVLQVAATERVWVAVDADGKTALQRVLNPRDGEILKAKESFDVTIGNAQGIILTLNGEVLKPLGGRGEVKSVHLTRDDLKNPTP